MANFGKREKLSPRYVGPYEIIERVGLVAYRLSLPMELRGIHDVFHVSSLKKSFGDQGPIVVDPSHIQLQPNMSYEEWPVQIIEIIDWKDHELRNRKIPLVKVLSNMEATWEREDSMRARNPHMFVS
ncbi:hypothetical protein F2P56_035397 [Juglans regia]|uniref:Tf2-1-like SH3-like domain-containing protein n=2 Tax=Juglans regia TaxID=51240 RepID=A0A833T428_JUGRE|nr:uncharacterized protein LOC109009797 [Juglans regia]KAF5442775.1 hypothetical protein F2P56_035397 [Juglans regia]